MKDPAAHRPLLSRRSLLQRGAVLSGAAAVGAGVAAHSGRVATMAPAAAAAALVTQPSWVPAGLTNNYDPALQVFNYKSTNTARHRSALLAAAAGTSMAHEVFIGDSSTDGYTGAVLDGAHSWPSVYAAAVSAAGIPVVGTGWVRAADLGGLDPRWSYDSHWIDVFVFRYTVTVGAAATFAPATAGTSVSVRFNAYANASFTVSVDGATSGNGFAQVSVGPSAVTCQTVTLSGLPNTAHSVVVTSTSTALLMVVAASVTADGNGLVISNVAQCGAKASGTGVYSWSDFANQGSPGGAWAASGHYPQTPSTVWISLGGNDIHAGIAPATVSAAVRSIAARFPDSDVFLVLEYQPNEISTAAWTAYAGALYQVADALDVPLFDQWARIGSYAAYSAQGYAGDTVAHLNAAGYAVLGNWAAGIAGVVPPAPKVTPVAPVAPVVNVVAASGDAVTLPDPATCALSFVTLSDDCQLTFPPATPGASFRLIVAQAPDVSHVVSWPTPVAWPNGAAPALSTTPGALDQFTFLSVDGVRWLGTADLAYS